MSSLYTLKTFHRHIPVRESTSNKSSRIDIHIIEGNSGDNVEQSEKIIDHQYLDGSAGNIFWAKKTGIQ